MEIKPYKNNAKKHPKKQIEQVANSIKEFGMNQPIVVDKEGVIIVGHGRYEALKMLGWEIKPEWVKVVDLNEEQAKAYRLADNKLNESEWDMGLAIEELKELSDEMFDLTGFDKDLLIEPEDKDDEVPETPVEPKSKLGDLYELGEHRVLCGDSTKIEDVEKLMGGKKADMVFTDPPYGVDYDGGAKTKRDKLSGDEKQTSIYADVLPILYAFSTDSSPFYIWHSAGYADMASEMKVANLTIRNQIIWNKNQAQYGALSAQYKQKHEPCFYAHKKGKAPTWNGPTNEVTVWDVDRHAKNEFHPTQKPVALSERAILNHIGSEGIVLDLFLGSGATLIGANKTGRICYGMELDPKYVDVIVQRYVDYTGNENIKLNGEDIIWKKSIVKTIK